MYHQPAIMDPNNVGRSWHAVLTSPAMVGRILHIVATAGAGWAAVMVDVVHPRKEEMVRRQEKTGESISWNIMRKIYWEYPGRLEYHEIY